MYAIHKLTNHLDGRKWQEEKRKEFISLVCLKQEKIKIDKVRGVMQFLWGPAIYYQPNFDGNGGRERIIMINLIFIL